jgi:hypothetical protein
MDLREKVAQLPTQPGVYLYKDAYGKVLYVGKAKNLRSRVRSYFNEDRLAEAKTGGLISEARDIDFIQVDNNKEALALENNLIKQYKPRFNLLWPVFSRQPGASFGSFHSPPFPGTVLQNRFLSPAHASLLAVPHTPLPGPVCGRSDNRQPLCRGCERRSFVSGRPPSRPG